MLQVFVEDKLDVGEVMEFANERVENIAGKGVNASYQHFSFSTDVAKIFSLRTFSFCHYVFYYI